MARVDSLMLTDGPRLTPDTPIRRAAALLAESGAAAAAVLDESGALVGILTEKDCFGPRFTPATTGNGGAPSPTT